MTTKGLSSTGFIPYTLSDILTDLQTDEQALIDPQLNVDATQPIGQINGIFAARLAEVWEILSVLYGSRNPFDAEGPLLDGLLNATGVRRQQATASVAAVNCALNAGTVLPAGVAAVQAPGATAQWYLVTSYTAGATGTYTLNFACNQLGAVSAPANTLTQISTPITGWTSATNATDATVGTNRESDAAYLARQQVTVTEGGAANDDAITKAVRAVSGVITAKTYSNRTSSTDANGTPAYSYQVLVWDGVSPLAANNDIAQAIWNSGPAGINYYGATAGTATDSDGNSRTVGFTRATVKTLYVSVTLTKDSTYPSDGDTQVKNAIVAKANATLTLGSTVYDLPLRAAALSIQGVLDVPVCNIGFTASPGSNANLSVGTFEIAVADTSRVVIS
jgi:uncharacterized phage protein gp47/JayE